MTHRVHSLHRRARTRLRPNRARLACDVAHAIENACAAQGGIRFQYVWRLVVTLPN